MWRRATLSCNAFAIDTFYSYYNYNYNNYYYY